MATMHFEEARACVLREVCARRRLPSIERVTIEESAGRVLAEPIRADRDYPPLDRSIRDGFAVRSADVPGRLRVVGEVRAGEVSGQVVGEGEALEIMTGAPLPPGADAVVMVEHTTRDGEYVLTERGAKPGEFINPRGAECLSGAVVLEAGRPIGFASIAMMATVGASCARVFARPRVAILATGDEIVEIDESPGAHQIRNSNARSLAVQVREAGGSPEILPVARDTYESTRELCERGLAHDLLLLSGGVSAGKYDVVEYVLADLGAEFFFDRVLIQPGQPLVFGRARDTFFFGLPGNPASTMITFQIFARAAVQLLAGEREPALPIFQAELTSPFKHKTGLTRFLPAALSPDGAKLTPIRWHGSSDVPSLARANAFLVAESGRESWNAGDRIGVLLP